MTFVFWVWRPGVSVCVLLLLCVCVCDGAERVIRHHCDCYEEDMNAQKDIGGFIQCSIKPGLGHQTECTEITDLRSGLEEVFPDVRSLRNLHSASSLPADSFSHIPLLEHLYVDGSHLAKLYNESPLILLKGVFIPLLSLSTLVFDQVDFRCDCSNGWLLDWADNSRITQVVILQRRQCIWHYQRLNFLSTMERLCQTCPVPGWLSWPEPGPTWTGPRMRTRG